MKNAIYYILILSLSMASCSSQKKIETTVPFSIGSASSQDWVGGVAPAGSGTLVSIEVTQMNQEEITLEQLYFRGKITPLSTEIEEGVMYAKADMKKKTRKPQDINMDADPAKEFGNKPTKAHKKDKEAFPFELQPDEAVISYKEGDKIKYFKVSGIKKKKQLIYPSAGPKE